MPLEGKKLVIEPTFPHAAILSTIGAPAEEKEHDADGKIKVRNVWWSRRLQSRVYVYEQDGKVRGAKFPKPHSMGKILHTMDCSDAWGIEQEARATQLLATTTRHTQFKHYMLTGMFLETSRRSGLTYLFRRLRPTLAIDARQRDASDSRILAALCMHPIAYYEDTWAGAMTPTDDVLAHLMLMRGDEHMFWKRCNQHHPATPEAGM